MRAGLVIAAALALLAQRALAQDTFLVAPKTLADEKAVFATVEIIRQTSIAFRREGDTAARRELEVTLNSLSHDRTIEVVRAFSYFSHLANIAEDQHNIRSMRANGGVASAAPGP